MTPALETINLTRRYGKTVALEQLSLAISSGSIYGFIGPNGAGKTTTLRLLAGLLEPSSGEIWLMGQRLSRSGSEAQRLVGYMPDFFGVYSDLRVWEYLDFFARCYGLNAARRRSTVEQLLDLVDLTPKRDAFVQSLSRGMQQRLCLAHALVHDPPLLFLDEPASGLDPRARVELRELLRTLRDMNKTVILSSHILSELAEVCDAIGIIDKGHMIISGSVPEVRSQLQSGHTLQIRVLRDADRADEILQSLPSTSELPSILKVRRDELNDRIFHIELGAASEEQQSALLAYLLTQGILVSDFHTTIEDLEDLFLRLTEVG
ncbi:MAG: ABC transporter ATP-binding protein [Chloroflexales bacterium]|nr:ABC transporter ATP-binding protein [Chloroflexales bacterium]